MTLTKNDIGCTTRRFQRSQLALLIATATCYSSLTQADDNIPYSWEINAIGATEAWAMGLSGKGVQVGVLDEGFLSQHPMMADGSNFHPLVRTKNIDGKNYSFDASQLDVETKEDGSKAYNIHGGAVTGIIASRPFAGLEYQGGVAQGADVYMALNSPNDGELPVTPDTGKLGGRILFPQMQSVMASGILSLLEAAPNLRVINNSWNEDPNGNSGADVDTFYQTALGNAQGDTQYFDALRQAAARDVLLVYAAGNESKQQPGFHAAIPRYLPELAGNYLSVVALNTKGEMASYSNYCGVSKQWCLAAPGDLQAAAVATPVGTTPVSYGYTSNSGTSFAAPIASGSAALLAERFPYMNMNQVRDVMLTTATQMGSERISDQYGWGKLNLTKAINGPEQLLGDQTYTLDAKASGWGARDTWSNSIVAGGRLTKAGTGALTLAGASNKFNGVTVNGGQLVLAGANTFSQASQVQGGQLMVDGSLKGPSVSVAKAGTLAGAGRIEAPTQVTGTLAAGHDGKPLTFSNSLTLASTSTTSVTPNGGILMDGAQAKAQVAGTLTANGATNALVISTSNGGQYSGTFSALKQDPTLLAQGKRYDLAVNANNMRLTTNSTLLPGQAGMTRNALVGAQLLNGLRDSSMALQNTGYNQWLQGALASGNLGGMETRVGGQVHADAFAYLAHQPQQLQSNLRNQLASTGGRIGRAQLWVNSPNDNLRHDGGNGIAKSKDSTNGLQAGMTYAATPQLALSGGVSQTKGKVRTAGDKVDIDLTYLSLGTRYGFNSLVRGPFIGAQAGIGYVDYSSKRNLGAMGTAKGDSHGWMNNVAVNGGYRWKFKKWFVEPQIGLQTTHLNVSKLKEKGSELDLQVKQGSQSYSSALFDVKAGRSLKLGKWRLIPSASLGYERALGHGIDTSKAGVQGYTLEQQAANHGKDLFKAGLDLDATYGNWGIKTGLKGVTGSGNSGGGANLEVSYRF
jgi:uncharacterized protein YhjY with autotransporter beta-barrel domain